MMLLLLLLMIMIMIILMMLMLADDGKRSHALDVVLALLLAEKLEIGEGSGEG